MQHKSVQLSLVVQPIIAMSGLVIIVIYRKQHLSEDEPSGSHMDMAGVKKHVNPNA